MKSMTLLAGLFSLALSVMFACATPRVEGDASPNSDNPSRSPAFCRVKWSDDYGGYICAGGNCPNFSCNPHRLKDGTVINVVKCLCH